MKRPPFVASPDTDLLSEATLAVTTLMLAPASVPSTDARAFLTILSSGSLTGLNGSGSFPDS